MMDTNVYDPGPEPEEKKKRSSGWLIGCGAGALVTLCVVVFVLVGGFAGILALFGGDPAGLEVVVTTPSSQVQVGEFFEVSIELSNAGTKNINVSEIRLPNNLLENAQITGINPSGTLGMDNDDQTAYEFDLLIAPTGKEIVVFSFEAIQPADISGSIEVSVGTKMASREMRVVISSEPVVIETEETEETEEPVLGEVIPYHSVVQIIAMVDIDGELVQGWWGSGTVVSEDGLILTNAHVVLSDRYYDVEDLMVAITVAQDMPPETMFYADILQVDANLDLAVIKVRSDLNGGPPNFEALQIDPVPLGSSDALGLGDELIIIGYPSIGGETITLTRGEVSGFTAEEPYGNRAFIKTSASISGGNSGGLAATPQGEIIGVPTQLGSGDEEVEYVDCRRLADTNRDGTIDENDSCVPTGGFINAIRPITLAQPLIDAAMAGQVDIEEEVGGDEEEEFDPSGSVIFSDDFSNNANDWAVGSSENGGIDIVNGQLTIDVYVDGYYFWTYLSGTYDRKDLVTHTQVLNPVGDGDYGFVCGVLDDDNFTALEISEDGYYIIWKYENGEYISLVDWSYSEMVAAGGAFKMAAYCGPDRLALAVNDVLLADTYDPNYVAGSVGLITGTYENPNLSVGFDDFFILEP
ncbi:MAG: serine protease [Chloroflexota bacterium]|nr:serine protease [Chloroflexota bacterium]